MAKVGKLQRIYKRLPQIKNINIDKSKIKNFALNIHKKHYNEFEALGYTPSKSDVLINDIKSQLDNTPAQMYYDDFGNTIYYTYMDLGIKEKRTFRIVWQSDKGKKPPRVITIYRRDRK